jgi:cation diffusion facilitator family transporter
MAASGGRRAILAAMFANAGIAVAKFVAFLFTRSSSMLAEAIHSVADTSNQGLLLLGGARARREATPTHEFGYARERYFWSFVVALVLFSLGGLFAIYEGVTKVRHPHEVESYTWAIVVLVIAIGLETGSFRTAIRESRPLKGRRSWGTFIRTARTPELPVVLLEDAGALFGLLFALTGILTTMATGDPVWDGVGTIAIGVLLVVIALLLTFEMKSLLIGESATTSDRSELVAALSGSPGVERIIHLRTQHFGPEALLVAGKVQLSPRLTFQEIADVIDRAETAMRATVPAATMIYLEPDVYDPDHVPTPDLLPDEPAPH